MISGSCRHVRESRRGENLWTIILVSRYTLTEVRCMAPILLTELMKFIAASKMSFCSSISGHLLGRLLPLVLGHSGCSIYMAYMKQVRNVVCSKFWGDELVTVGKIRNLTSAQIPTAFYLTLLSWIDPRNLAGEDKLNQVGCTTRRCSRRLFGWLPVVCFKFEETWERGKWVEVRRWGEIRSFWQAV